jgi:hypothetical protein
MNNRSTKQFFSWVAAIAFILAYLFFVNPWVNNLGLSQSNIDVVRASSGLVSGTIDTAPGGVTIHTPAGSLLIGEDTAVTTSALDTGRMIFRLGSIVFVPAETEGF